MKSHSPLSSCFSHMVSSRRPHRVIASALVAYLVASANPAIAADESDSLWFGMSAALTGPAADLGLNMRAGILAAFEEQTRNGGIHGKQPRLRFLDDGYEPGRTAPNMRKLVDDKSVLGIIGNVGTPTAIAAIPIANERRTLFYGSYTGAGVLRRAPPDRYVINFRASYAEETAAMVDALTGVAGIDPRRIAFFTQRDGYGDSGYRGGVEALKRHGVEDETQIAHGRYERNTTAVESGLAEILQTEPLPQAVIMVGAYAPCAEFIRLAREFDLDAIFLNVSFVGSASLARELGAVGENVIITQVVPHPSDELPIVRDFQSAIRMLDPNIEPTFGALEGYIAARILMRALANAESISDRESVVDALEGLGEFDIGLGTKLRLDDSDHQASHSVWPTVIRDSKVVPFNWNSLTTHPAVIAP